MLRFLTAGESHGQALVVIVEGLPAGLPIDAAAIDTDLARRQHGYGRGQRMRIESDHADILSGVRAGESLGSPVALQIANRDWRNWQRTMRVGVVPDAGATGPDRPPVTRPRPGHADLAAGLKYDRADLRDVLERASARETAARVAAGALARQLLAQLGIEVLSHVTGIGPVAVAPDPVPDAEDVRALAADSPLRCVDRVAERDMMAAIDAARDRGDTLGGTFEVIATGVPVGLGSHVQWDRKLDGRLAQAVMSIPAVKAVGFGLAFDVARRPGSGAHDEILIEDGPAGPALVRPTNRAGGLEGGVTNGQPVRLTAAMKPISTLMKPLRSVDLSTLREALATVERSDVCAVPAAAAIAEAMVCLVLADAALDKFGADTLAEIRANHRAFLERIASGLASARASVTRAAEP